MPAGRVLPESSEPADTVSLYSGESRVDATTQARVESVYGKLPMQFEANQGQVTSQVKFVSRGGGYTLFLTPTEAVLSLKKREVQSPGAGVGLTNKQLPMNGRIPDAGKTSTDVVRMKLVGGNPSAKVAGADELPGKVNYFIGNDPKKWRTNVRTYEKVNYQGVYPGVDLVYYGNQRQLEYDFVVSPHADPLSIKLAFDGARQVRIDDSGALVLKTESGEEIRQHKPVMYQEIGGERKEVAGNYILRGRNEVGFEFGEYDRNQTLVIDPTLSYSTFLGGGVDDLGHGIAVDATGNAYVTGQTSSLNFPTAGAFQTNHGAGGGYDAFITKLNANGTALIYSTYLGGQNFERAERIAVDSSGRAGITGYTQSLDFPTASAFQPTKVLGADAFVTVLSANGSALVYSTFLGGGGFDEGSGIAFDSTGSAYVTGLTTSDNFPILGNLQTTRGGGADAFVTKFNVTGTLVYSSYVGGLLDDDATGIAVDSLNNAYITGNTVSTNFPTTLNSYQPQSAGNTDAFVTKVNAAGTAFVYSTYLGSTGSDFGTDIKVDSSNPANAYVTGPTSSPTFPIIRPAAQETHRGGFYDGFVTKVNGAGNQLIYSTFLGGSDSDEPRSLAIDGAGNASVVGQTASTDFPTLNALQSINAYSFDGFITKVNSTGNAFVYSTYLGGTGIDDLTGIASGSTGVYVTGYTDLEFPTTAGVVQPTQAPPTSSSVSINDAIVARIVEGTDPTYSAIKGRVTNPNGTGVAGMVIRLTGGQSRSTTTNGDGYYIFQLLNPLPSYTVSPETGVPTSPATLIYPIGLFGNVTNADFIAIQPVLTISGRLTNVNRTGLTGFQVSLSGSATKSTLTDWNGVFSFLVPSGGNYTVSPPLDARITNWKLSNGTQANSISHTNLTQSVSNDNFEAATPQFTVAGKVRTAGGTALVNVDVNLFIPGVSPTTDYFTNGTGDYTSDQLPVQGDYVFTPQSKTIGSVRYSIYSPASVSFVSNLSCVQANLPPNTFCSGPNYLAMNFTAFPEPNVVTSAATAITAAGATLNGSVNPNGLATSGWFEWGTDPQLTTNTATATQAIGSGSSNQAVAANLTGLIAGTPYYFQAVGMSSGGTVTGSILTFTTPALPRTLTVASTNPVSSVSITVSPNDNNAAGNGSTQFTRTYNNNQVVSLTAPATASGNNFQKWLKDGADFAGNTSANVNLAMDANHTMTAVYVTPPRTLTVASSNPTSGVSITVSPNDNNAAGNGSTQFARTYNNNQVVSLTAPSTTSGNNFQKWLKDGADFANNTSTNVSVVMDANHTMTAVYLTPPRTLTVTSTNPANGVSIAVSPNDNNAAGNGSTQFTRTYNNNQVVSLTAPATAGGNNFQKWLRDGADFANNTLANVSVTMDANHMMTAVYLSPTRTLTVASTNPASGVAITVSPNDNNASGNGTTQFTRVYNNTQTVSLTAPTTASGNNFQKWLKDGADFANNTLANVSVTMDADHNMMTVYVAPKTIQFSSASYSVSETGPRADVTVTRSGDTASAAAVNFVTNDNAGLTNCNVINGIASARCDYENTIGTATWAAGDASPKIFSIAIVDDGYAEGNETFTIGLNSPSGATLGAQSTATVTINDNEATNGPNPIDNTNFFVRQQYIDFLGREPDPAGFAGWTSTINNCSGDTTQCDRIHVSQLFFQSAEFQQRGYFVYRFYPVAFGRKPDYAEFVPDLASVSGFLSDAQLEAAKVAFIAAFMARPAFVSAYNSLNNTQYVDALLNTAGVTLSNRQAMIDGLNNSSLTRGSVLRQIVESTEVSVKYNHQAYSVMEYFGYLRRQPDGGYLAWIAVLDGSNDPRGMVTGFVNSIEYRNRFGP